MFVYSRPAILLFSNRETPHMSLLKIDGLVEQEVELDFAALRGLSDQVDDISPLVPGREGAAVRLSAVLAAANPSPEAARVQLESSDGAFSRAVGLAAVQDALVTYRLGEDPLPDKYGGPIRFFIPDAAACGEAEADACANVKMLGRITLLG